MPPQGHRCPPRCVFTATASSERPERQGLKHGLWPWAAWIPQGASPYLPVSLAEIQNLTCKWGGYSPCSWGVLRIT